MFAVVPGQFIGAGEFPPTAVPVTVVRFLACVSSQVCLEMRTLRIGFATACIVTSVGGCSFPGPRPSSPLWLGLLWQAGTRWHELLIMERGDLRRHLVWQERRVVGPPMGMESWGKRQAGVTVSAVQQFLGTQCRGSPGGELPPQGPVLGRWPLLSWGPALKWASRDRLTVQDGTASCLILGHMRGGPPL